MNQGSRVMNTSTIAQNKDTVRKCKAIRNRIYDREQCGGAVLRREVQKLIASGSAIADIGCGREARFLRSLSLSGNQIAYGVDREISGEAANGNVRLMCGDAEAIPLGSSSVDVVTMLEVMEHLRHPSRVLQECGRILKPGGNLLILTPCKYYPPILLGRALPHRARQLINAVVTRTEAKDTFPVYYRANSARDLSQLASQAGLDVVCVRYLEYHPMYFMFSVFLYRCAVAVERVTLSRGVFSCFRHEIFCHLKKPGGAC